MPNGMVSMSMECCGKKSGEVNLGSSNIKHLYLSVVKIEGVTESSEPRLATCMATMISYLISTGVYSKYDTVRAAMKKPMLQ
jgi:hypothetical protein